MTAEPISGVFAEFAAAARKSSMLAVTGAACLRKSAVRKAPHPVTITTATAMPASERHFRQALANYRGGLLSVMWRA
ncbi:MAG TPA: hypothetical protein DEA50_12805 [Parvularcula sp.]|nr:hypothetical protein [Parvularcula sp.]